jgi:hypothetical protein
MPDARAHPDDLAAACERLASILDELARAYEAIEASVERRESAVRGADLAALARAVAEESAVIQAVAEIEQRRGRLAEAIAGALGAPSANDVNARWIAQRVPACAQRLLAASGSLRERVERVQRRNASARVALETLASHMKGLLQTAERRMSHAGVYGRRGAVEAGAPVLSAMDVVS